jgi:hypothetical protein
MNMPCRFFRDFRAGSPRRWQKIPGGQQKLPGEKF